MFHTPHFSPRQPRYPAVMPIWISETDDKLVVDLIGDLNMSEGACAATTHPVSGGRDTQHKGVTMVMISIPFMAFPVSIASLQGPVFCV